MRKQFKRGDLVRARDYKDENWEYGIYIEPDRSQGAHRVLICPDGGKLRPVLFNIVEHL